MKRNFKIFISILLCFLMLFGEMMPVGLAAWDYPTGVTAENYSAGVDEVSLTDGTNVTGSSTNETSVTDSVYDVGELPINNDTLGQPDQKEEVSSDYSSIYSALTISGTVSLPTGKVAPSGGLSVRVYAKSSTKTSYVNVVIPEDESTVDYTVNVADVSLYTVYYYLSSDNDYVRSGYYSQSGTVRSSSTATQIDLSTTPESDINLTLIAKKRISGIIVLPDDTAPVEGVTFTVKAECGSDRETASVTIPEGSNSIEYTLKVPPNIEGTGYLVSYQTSNKKYLSPAYYSTNGSVRYNTLASIVDVSSEDKENINLNVIAKKKISGTISLPEGEAPEGGIAVTIQATYGSDKDSSNITIPVGASSASYTLYVPDGSAYTVNYQTSNVAYLSKGYYNINGTVNDIKATTPVDTVSGDKSDINLTLIAKRIIGGTVSLPKGTASEDISVQVIVAYNNTKVESTTVTIPKDEAVVPYSIYVPTGSGYNVSYKTTNDLYVDQGYYNKNSMVRYLSSATLIDVANTDITDVNLTLIEKRSISGVLSMPSGVAPAGGITYVITASNGSEKAEVEVTIPEDQSSVPYSINVPADTGYIVKCELVTLQSIYMNTIYYSSGGSVFNVASATSVDTTSSNQPDINIMLLEKRTVSGTLSLPSGFAPEGGLTFYHQSDGRITEITIDEGKSSAPFTLYFNPEIIKLFYQCGEDSIFVSPGYYSKGGTVMSAGSADSIDLRTGNQVGINIVLLLKKTITGSVVLPNGVASEGGYTVKVKALGSTGKAEKSVTISQGERSADYILFVNPGDKYKVWYEAPSEYNFVSPMYYNSDGMVRDVRQASLLDLSTENKTNIDLSLMDKRTVSGNVVLPSGVAPAGGINMNVVIFNSKDTTEVPVTIKAGSSFASYTAYVPAGTDYKVKYEIDLKSDYATDGYYGVSGTTLNASSAALLDLTLGNKTEINMTLILKRLISGTVSLPSGVASSGEIKLSVYAGDSYFTSVTIPQNETTTPYTVKVPPNIEGSGYKVYYKLTSNTIYVSPGYYNSNGMTAAESGAELVDVSSSDKEANLVLLPKSSINGSVILPQGVAPRGGLRVTVTVSNSRNKGSVVVTIPEETNSVPYTVYVPSGAGYKVEYQISDEAYIEKGYYNVTGTVKDSSAASLVDLGNENKQNINLTLIAKNKIAGSVSLTREVAPSGGLKVKIYASNTINKVDTTVTIPQGYNSINYTLYVPEGEGYIVWYEATDRSVMPVGYYSDGGTTVDIQKAKAVNATTSASSINIALIAKKKINGDIRLSSAPAPAGGISVKVMIDNGIVSDSVDVVIPEEFMSAPYSLYVPEGEGYVVQYTTPNISFVSPGYYANSGTTEDESKATLLNPLNDISGLDITLITKRTIRGTIMLPEGYAPTGGVEVKLTASNENDKIVSSFTIPAEEKSVPYILYVSSDKEYIVKYETKHEIYVDTGYYSTYGTTRDVSEATTLDTTEADQVGINFKLISKKCISGTVSIPSGIAPFGGIKIKLVAANGKDRGEKNVVISEVSSSTTYKLYVPAGDGYELSYIITNPDGKYLYPGYYNGNGASRDPENSTLIDLSSQDAEGINISLIPNRLVTGNIVLPSGTAPAEGLKITVTASNSRDRVSTQVIMPQGSSSIVYRMYLPEGIDYTIGYTIGHEDYLSGYYNMNETVLDKTDATPFDVAQSDISGLNIIMVPKRIISGIVSLPQGKKAPAGGIDVTVSTGRYSTAVTIPQDSDSAVYTLKVSPNMISSGYTVKYIIPLTFDYVPTGYYNEEKTVAGRQTASLVDVSSTNKTDVNLSIMDKRIIAGTFRLPSGVAPQGGMDVTISAEGRTAEGRNEYWQQVVRVPFGENQAVYELKVDPNYYGSGYKLKYTIESSYGYAENGYYNDAGTVQNDYEATLVDVYDSDQLDRDLTAISKNYISGIISLPGGVAPAGGVTLSVLAENSKGSGSVNVTIPQGSSFAVYQLIVPPGTQYKLSYSMAPNNKYVSSGYYSLIGTVSDPAKAELFEMNGNIEGKEMVLIAKRKISGEITLPSGTLAPRGGLEVEICAENKLHKDSITVRIPESGASKHFELYMPPETEYRLYYTMTSGNEYVEKGYYADGITVLDQRSAAYIDVSSADFTNALLKIIKNSIIEGNIILPSGDAPEGGIEILVTAENNTYRRTANVLIPEGSHQIKYTLPVPPAAGYTVSYQVSTGIDYMPKGYYNSTGTVTVRSDATQLDLTLEGQNGVDVTLVNYNSISGTISLPEGNAPDGGVTVTVFAANYRNERQTTVTIPATKSSVDYNIYVPDGSGYKVYYVMTTNDKYADKGYYTPLKTVLNEQDTMAVDVIGGSISDINLSIIAKRTISGTISLPEGEAAPQEGLAVRVNALGGDEQTVVIPYGQRYVPYSLKVLPNVLGQGYKVKFETIKDYGFIRYGYYTDEGSVRNEGRAQLVDVSSGDKNNIDILIVRPRTITGKVMLPEDAEASKGMTISVIASNTVDSAEAMVYIPKGEKQAQYTLSVPPNDDTDEYKVRYENWLDSSYAVIGYYSTSATVRNVGLATGVNVRSGDAMGIDVSLIAKKTVSGKVSLPYGTAPKGGLVVTVSVQNDTDKSISYVTIPEEKTSMDYSISVPVGRGYRVSYEISTKNDFVPWGYYGIYGTTYMTENAQLVDISSDLSSIDMELIVKKSISGIVSLPNGGASAGGIKVEIYAEGAGDTWVTIPEGENFVPYTMKVIPNLEGKGYTVKYIVSSSFDLVGYGYYSENGTVRNSKLASMVNANYRDVTGINIKIMEPRKVSGKISLPDGVEPLEEITLNITVFNEVDGNSQVVTIPAGSNFADYSISLPPNDPGYEYKVKYENWSNRIYTTYGYYRSAGTTNNLSLADLVNVNQTDADSIDMTLLRKMTVSGRIDVPANYTVPEEGLDLKLFVSNDVETYSTNVNIPYGVTSVPYSVHVEAGSGYRLFYTLGDNDSIMEYGYYGQNGIYTDKKKAKVFSVANENISGYNVQLLAKRKISGELINPYYGDGDRAFDVNISASNGSNVGVTKVRINPLQLDVKYTLSLPADTGYILQYEILPNQGFAPLGYYNSMGMVRTMDKAELLDLRENDLSDSDISLIRDMSISGTVKLPFGVAPEGGLDISVTATDTSGSMSSYRLTIPEGESSNGYYLSVPPNGYASGYKVRYSVVSDDYATLGYYSVSGTKVLSDMATLVDVSSENAEEINLMLIEKKTVSGVISLPEGVAGQDGLTVSVRATSQLFSLDDAVTVVIPEGQSKVPYSLKVSPNVEGADYKISYEVSSGKGYISKGYYNSAGTVPDIKIATPVDVSSGDYTNANIYLIKSRNISGRVTLPEGEKAPAGGIAVTVSADKTDYTGYRVSTNILIPENENYADYTLTVPESTSKVVGVQLKVSTDNGSIDTVDDYSVNSNMFVPMMNSTRSSDYKVGYSYNVNDTYFRSGFYSETGTVPVLHLAGILNVSLSDVSNVDFALLKKNRTIKGIVSLPAGKTAPAGGIWVDITAESDSLDYSPQSSVIIGQGNSLVAYEISVPALDNYHIKYTLKSASGFVTSGYYAQGGTKGRRDLSTTVNAASGNVEGINLNLIPGKAVKGRVYLPEGHTVRRDDFWMWVSASNENYESSVYVTIPRDNSWANYTVYVPEGSDYIVSYSLLPLFGEYAEKGYHNSSTTTPNISCATKLNVVRDIININLTLLPANRTISGTISLPDGTASVPYSISVLSNSRGSGYKLEYTVKSGNTVGLYNDSGYFSQFGTSSDPADAAFIDVSNKNATDKDLILITGGMLPVEAIILDKLAVTLQSGRSVGLDVKFLPENATNKEIKWFTSNTNIAVVSSEGVVTGKAPGTAVITAVSHNGTLTACTITVIPSDLSGLSIDKASISINPGETEQLEAIFSPPAEDDGVIWLSDNQRVATVSDEGLVTAVSTGSAVITAVSIKDDSIFANCNINVITPVTEVELDKHELEVKVGYADKLTASVLPEDASYKGIVWTSDSESIVKVSQLGDITAIKLGTAYVTARSIYNPSIKAVCKVLVVPVPVEGVILDKQVVSLYPDDYVLINADVLPANATDKSVRWESANNNIASVTAEGLVKAIGLGETTITAISLYDTSKKAVCVVRVIPRPVTRVKFTSSVETVKVGSSKTLEVTISPDNATNKKLVWTSSDETIATVTEDGLITGRAVGAVTITAAWEDNPQIKDVCTLTVEPIKVSGVALNTYTSTMDVGEEITIVATVLPANATNKNIVWTSNNTSVATVSSTGVVTALAAGRAVITAASEEDGTIKAVCTITVNQAEVSSVSLSRSSVSLVVGDSVTLYATISPTSAPDKRVEWKSNNTSVAVVSTNGVVTAVGPGNAVITVTSKVKPTCKDTCSVYVSDAISPTPSVVPTPSPTAIIDFPPVVIPGVGGDVPIVSLDGTPTPTATPMETPLVTPSPTPTESSNNSNSISFFTDVKGHWAAGFFEDLLRKNIINGYPDRTLRPNIQITRAEATVMVMKAAGFEISDNIKLTCSDKDLVPAWARAYIATAMYNGVVKGYEDASFRPSNKLTRKETVVLVLRAFGIEEAQDKTLTFVDSQKVPGWSSGYVKKAVELGIIKGYNDNTFGPDRQITRAEVATIIAKCMELKGR